ncbi:hypothetical protein DAETH_12870 [Deinococcus aetherius]|uniref:Mobile element protein n=1 Tax=Deinococcus aetherius TaxID=200252 RepID=A0ABM8AC66_9DEIO|nr:hypothetical protein [Deinococcus aetherius]BDP41318.1 hypothetical protein DAETH_12870 [Deinococcus aetherius]
MRGLLKHALRLAGAENRSGKVVVDSIMSRSIEPLALIWITHGFNSGWTKRSHAFKLLNR